MTAALAHRTSAATRSRCSGGPAHAPAHQQRGAVLPGVGQAVRQERGQEERQVQQRGAEEQAGVGQAGRAVELGGAGRHARGDEGCRVGGGWGGEAGGWSSSGWQGHRQGRKRALPPPACALQPRIASLQPHPARFRPPRPRGPPTRLVGEVGRGDAQPGGQRAQREQVEAVAQRACRGAPTRRVDQRQHAVAAGCARAAGGGGRRQEGPGRLAGVRQQKLVPQQREPPQACSRHAESTSRPAAAAPGRRAGRRTRVVGAAHPGQRHEVRHLPEVEARAQDGCGGE